MPKPRAQMEHRHGDRVGVAPLNATRTGTQRSGPSAPNVTRGDIPLPALVVKEPALKHNISVMARYTADRGVLLAPHGKTTMAPALFSLQLSAGAWAITVANTTQASVAFTSGARRVLIANEMIGLADARAAVELLRAADRRLLCLVDSPAGVQLLDRNLENAGLDGRVDVLVEVGAPAGRAGVRSMEEASSVATWVRDSRHLRLVGVEGFEGTVASDRSAASLTAVGSYLERLRQTVIRLADEGAFLDDDPVLVSAGGSKYFDQVVEVLGPSANYGGIKTRLVVRPGCYVVHDHGLYAGTSPLVRGDDALLPALEVWAEVLSLPERGLAIVGMGKRDVSFDFGLPVALKLAREGQPVREWRTGKLDKLDDQHGYLTFDDEREDGLMPAVGDRIGFGVSHPCTALDKWRNLVMVDDEGYVRGQAATFFH